MKPAAVVLGLLLCPPLAWAIQSPPPEEPSLAQLAEKTKKGRTKPRPGKVLTNEDLKNAKGNVIVLPAEAAPKGEEATKPEGEVDKDAGPKVATGEIQGRIDELSGRIARLRKAVEEAQRELAAGEGEAERRAVLTKTVEENQKAMADAELMILGLHEMARRQGLPVSRP